MTEPVNQDLIDTDPGDEDDGETRTSGLARVEDGSEPSIPETAAVTSPAPLLTAETIAAVQRTAARAKGSEPDGALPTPAMDSPGARLGRILGDRVRCALTDLYVGRDINILPMVGAIEDEMERAAESEGIEAFEALAKAAFSLSRNATRGTLFGWAMFRVIVLQAVDCYRLGRHAAVKA